MKLFIDANVLVSVLNKEYPLFSYSSRVLSLADHQDYQLFTSPTCLAIGFYFSGKKSGRTQAKKKIKILSEKMKIATISERAVNSALENVQVNDIEDGFQNYAAEEASCNAIITENISDFYFSNLEVIKSYDFLQKYVFK